MLDPTMRADVIAIISTELTNLQQVSRLQRGLIQSGNFVTGVRGWQITADGNAEFNNGTFRGSLTASSIAIPNNVTANSFHTDSSGNSWWGATTFAAAPASISSSGDAIFNSVTIKVPQIVAATIFETAARFIMSGTPPTVGQYGLAPATTNVAGSQSVCEWQLSSQTGVALFGGSPTFTCSVNGFTTTQPGLIYVGIGNPSSAGAYSSVLAQVGFKMVITGGVITLYGVQADNAAGQATGPLTTILSTDSVDLIAIMNGSTSVSYYWRKNGGARSVATTVVGNVPNVATNIMAFFTDNQINNNFVICYVGASSYIR